MPPFYLLGPQQTNWLDVRRDRLNEAAGPFERAIANTTSDMMSNARNTATPGSGAANARNALAALAPATARLRSDQANAVLGERRQIRQDMAAENNARRDWLNGLIGGIAGIGSQMMVPLIGGLGNGGGTGVNGAPAGMDLSALAGGRSAFAAGMAPGLPDNSTVPEGFGSGPRDPSAPGAAMGPGALTPEEEERRRRGGGLGSMLSMAAGPAGMANPLAGLGLGLAGRMFGG